MLCIDMQTESRLLGCPQHSSNMLQNYGKLFAFQSLVKTTQPVAVQEPPAGEFQASLVGTPALASMTQNSQPMGQSDTAGGELHSHETSTAVFDPDSKAPENEEAAFVQPTDTAVPVDTPIKQLDLTFTTITVSFFCPETRQSFSCIANPSAKS